MYTKPCVVPIHGFVRYICRSRGGVRKTAGEWDPTVSLSLNHPTLLLLERCESRIHFKQILAQMMRNHLTAQTFPMSRLLYFSAISHPQNTDIAVLLFNHFTPSPNLYIYNTMVSAFSASYTTAPQSFALYSSMLKSRIFPDKHTLLYLIRASECLAEGMQIHCHAIVTGLFGHGYLQNSLLKMYLENGQMDLAHQLFEEMPNPDAVSFNIMIVEYAKKGCSEEALDFFCEMLDSGLKPDEYTMTGVLMCCGRVGDSPFGRSVHAWLQRRMLISSWNLVLGNALLDMYVKCQELKLARRIFDMFLERDIVSWNTIIAGHAKVGELALAHTIFNEMPCKDLVSWNSLIAGYAQRGDYMMVRKLFTCMITDKVWPDAVTLVHLVSAASEVGALYQGRQIHGWLVRMQIKVDAFLSSALVHMYCKCGSIKTALLVFSLVTEKDVTLWTTMVRGMAFHGHGHKALEMFSEMQQSLAPNHVTFVALLTACVHSGLVDEGLKVFNSMKQRHGIEPQVEHYGCLVDLLARSGRLIEAKDIINKMPMEPSRSIWGALLNACRAHGNIELAETAWRALQKLEPQEEGAYLLLCNMYAAYGRWLYADNLRETMEDKGLKKTAGFSSVVVDGVAHKFVATDTRHPRWMELHSILLGLKSEMVLSSDALFGFMRHSLLD